MTRDDYGTGSTFQRTSDWRWVVALEHGFTESGGRRRVTVSSKGCVGGCPPRCAHRAEIRRKRDRKRADLERGEAALKRITVKQWADAYLAIRVRDLSPKGYNAAASPIRKWIVPTIGHRRLDTLTPGDLRAVDAAQRAVGNKPAATRRALMTMLRHAVGEGYHVPSSTLATRAPKDEKSDRAAMTEAQGIACLELAAEIDHGTRWLFTLLYGARLGESLGLTWDAIDFDAGECGEAVIEWQLQSLPYNVHRDRTSGFRVPDGYEARHLVDSFHLVRPKSRAGYRVAPFLPSVRDALLTWREIAPSNEWGLVWPNMKGRPANDKHDREEWHALQATVSVGHPTRTDPHGFFHVHECRNFAATMLLDSGVPEHVVTDLLGHSAVATSLRYRTRRREPLMDAMKLVGERLQLGR